MQVSAFGAFWTAAGFGVLLPLAGLLWKAARRSPSGCTAAAAILYAACLLCALYPESLPALFRVPGPQDWLYQALTAGRWQVGGSTVSLGAALAVCWLTGSGLLLMQYLLRYHRAARAVRRYAVPADERTQRLLYRLGQERERPLRVSVFTLRGIDTPYGFGILHRRILLPEIDYPEAELRCILRHEYTHFLRRDTLLRQLALLLGIIYWWSPAAYLLGDALEQAAELQCDAAATRHMDRQGRLTYLRAVMKTLKADGQEPAEAGCEGLRERFAAVLTGGEGGGPAPWTQGGGRMVKRSWLYLTRKYKRSILLLLLMFAISFSVSVGICVWNSINRTTHEIELTLGTGFRLKVPSFFRSDPAYSREVTGAHGETTLEYAGPKLDDTIVEEIRKLDGVAQYDAELTSYVVFESGKLFPGLFTWAYNTWDMSLHAEGDTIEKQDVWARETTVYGHTDTALSDPFRTGSFSLAEGRHITEGDQWKVLISDKLAEINSLQVGDHVAVSLREGLGGYPDFFNIVGEMKTLEIVGIFHVNGFQPESDWVAEHDSTYNYLLTDLGTAIYFDQAAKVMQYGSPRDSILYENLTFFVEDPASLDAVMQAVRELDTIDVSKLDFAADDTMYQSTVGPLHSIRNLVVGLAAVIAAGGAAVLCIIFTMWVRSRQKEIAVYLSMGFRKTSIIGQFVLEAAIVAVAAGALSFAACQQVPGLIGNRMLASAIENAQPQEQEITREEIHQAAMSGAVGQLYRYESGDYAGPEHIDFTFRAADFALLLLLELLIITGAVCKGGAFLFRLQPRQILTDFR